jgi:hypothetical protein
VIEPRITRAAAAAAAAAAGHTPATATADKATESSSDSEDTGMHSECIRKVLSLDVAATASETDTTCTLQYCGLCVSTLLQC